MRSNVVLWWILTVFFLIVGTAYTWWSTTYYEGDLVRRIEWVGTVVLFFSAFMSAHIAFYLGRVHNAQRGDLPEDVLTADIDDGEPEQGHFSPWSWWPIVLAFAAALGMIGLAVGTWMMPIGFAVLIVALVGWVYEYYRGYHAR
ncbi:MAG: cytochrome c oxidase subunit 4 [Candidatus Cloacimonetes bacterium]|nr:cytochrome c oxidase subunit 4 [Candidatus Cloacimonadota bacterium]